MNKSEPRKGTTKVQEKVTGSLENFSKDFETIKKKEKKTEVLEMK